MSARCVYFLEKSAPPPSLQKMILSPRSYVCAERNFFSLILEVEKINDCKGEINGFLGKKYQQNKPNFHQS